MPPKSRIETAQSRLKPGQSLRDLSPIAEQLAGQNADDLRIDKVMELRQAINAGSYDVDQRVEDLLGKLETNLSGLVQAEADAQPPDAADPLDEADNFDRDDFQDEFESLDALNDTDEFDPDFDDEYDRY